MRYTEHNLTAEAPAYGTEEHIRHLRRELNPNPVKLHEVPEWVRRACLKIVKGKRWRGSSTRGPVVLEDAVNLCSRDGWCDHWGTVVINGKQCLASEPYGMTAESMKSAIEFAEKIGARLEIDSNSWWFPGRTVRLTFFPPNSP